MEDDPSNLAAIDASLNEGEGLTPRLVSIAKKTFSRTLAADVVKKKYDLCQRNCIQVKVPKLNKDIWRRVQGSAIKRRDFRLMNIQRAITKSPFGLCKVAYGLLKPDKAVDREALIHAYTDAIFLLGHANTSVSFHRRDLLKLVLKNDSFICDSNVNVTSYLYGDDLSKTLKEVTQTSNVGRNFTGSKNLQMLLDGVTQRKTTLRPEISSSLIPGKTSSSTNSARPSALLKISMEKINSTNLPAALWVYHLPQQFLQSYVSQSMHPFVICGINLLTIAICRRKMLRPATQMFMTRWSY